MIDTIYIENEIATHPRTKKILKRFSKATQIKCDRYSEIFNRKSQNFRLQKNNPALILAKKHKGMVLQIPKQFGIGAKHNYYFSHMLNCIYDCRYCFLQGMFQSANYVLFVNYEDFINDIESLVKTHSSDEVHFFSGYDCDSLALDPVTHFISDFLPFFEENENALIELRTKSTQIASLLKRPVINNCVVAFSFTPEKIASLLEHKTPAISKRLEAAIKLQKAGWNIGLRFDPLIYTKDFTDQYKTLFNRVFSEINIDLLHSVSLGNFRLPKDYFRKLEKLYPEELLLASPLVEDDGIISYPGDLRDEMVKFCENKIKKYTPKEKFFPSYEVA